MNHYQQEYQSRAIIDAYRRDALRAEQLRIARTRQRGSIAAVAMGFRASIASVLIAAGEHKGQEPVARPLPDNGVHA